MKTPHFFKDPKTNTFLFFSFLSFSFAENKNTQERKERPRRKAKPKYRTDIFLKKITWQPVKATMLAQTTVSCRPSATTTSALRSLTTRHSNSTSRISTTRSAPTRPSAINKPLRFRASPRSRPPSPRRRSALSSSEPRRRRCRWTSRTGRRSWETSTEIITGTGTTPTTTNSTATKRARTEGGSRRTSFWRSRWRGRGSLRSRCTKALGELWKEEISVGSEMQFGKKLGSKIKILLHNKKLIIECWKSRNIKYGGIFFRIFFIPTVVLVYSFFFFFFFLRV